MAIVVDPSQSSLVYAGAYAGGLFKSTNGGVRWKVQVKGLNNETVQALAIDAAVPATLYAGSLKAGVYKSTDHGTTWVEANTGTRP